MKQFITLAFVAMALTGLTAPAAVAANNGYALTTVENPTQQTIHYSAQWGDGPWVQYSLGPGQYRVHSWTYDDDGPHSPTFRVRFDSTLCDDRYVAKQYALSRYAYHCVDRWGSKRYVFRITGCFLDLHAVN